MPRIDKAISIQILPWIIPGGIAVLILFLVNTFFFQFILIPSKDMRPNYNQGDLVLLYKTNTFKNSDVVAFRHYSDDSSDTKPLLFVQRCIALPGDTFKIESGFVSVNSIEENTTDNYLFNYHIKSKTQTDSIFKIEYGLTEGGAISNEMDYSFSITEKIADDLRKDTSIVLVQKNIEKGNFRDDQMYINDTVHKWNKHNFGPVYVPKKGDVLYIDTANIFIYKKLIETETRQRIGISNDSVFLNKAHIKSHTVKENYYFVLGDNRDNALDSRYWGLLPENYILGKIVRVVYKKNK